jgi:hypothetical protein
MWKVFKYSVTLYSKVLFMTDKQAYLRHIRIWIIAFMICLALSGLTAFPLETELSWLLQHWPFTKEGDMYDWIVKVQAALADINGRYPFLAYGYDWLAFAHLVIALAFIGALKDPIRNIWVIEFGMMACILIFPLAFIAGQVRGIPLFWRLIDCSFGLIGLIPLGIVHKLIKRAGLDFSDQKIKGKVA